MNDDVRCLHPDGFRPEDGLCRICSRPSNEAINAIADVMEVAEMTECRCEGPPSYGCPLHGSGEVTPLGVRWLREQAKP